MNDVFVIFTAITLLVFLLAAGFVTALVISSREKMRQQIVLAETRLSFERELRVVETEVTESMMSRFAQELHDNIGQLLTALHIQVENIKLDHAQIADSLGPAEIYITEINQQLRILSRTLNNDFIGHIGLVRAVQLECERLQTLKRFSISMDLSPGNTNLEKNEELMVFRIFQEIVQNSLRHAKAKTLNVKIGNAANKFRMTVRDDGRGFDLEETIRSGRSSGLGNIKKRAALAGFELTIDTAPGKGCLYILEKTTNLGSD